MTWGYADWKRYGGTNSDIDGTIDVGMKNGECIFVLPEKPLKIRLGYFSGDKKLEARLIKYDIQKKDGYGKDPCIFECLCSILCDEEVAKLRSENEPVVIGDDYIISDDGNEMLIKRSKSSLEAIMLEYESAIKCKDLEKLKLLNSLVSLAREYKKHNGANELFDKEWNALSDILVYLTFKKNGEIPKQNEVRKEWHNRYINEKKPDLVELRELAKKIDPSRGSIVCTPFSRKLKKWGFDWLPKSGPFDRE